MVRRGAWGRAPRGVALINALVVVAALAAVAVLLMQRAERARQRLEDILPADQAALYLDAATLQVQAVIEAAIPAEDGAAAPVHPGQGWAEPVRGLDIDRGQVGWEIADLQGRFNLTWLQLGADGAEDEQPALAEDIRAAFARLAGARGLTRDQQRRLEQALIPQLGQRFSAYGRATRPPPLPPVALAELLLIRGLDDAAIAALRPVVATLPEGAGGLNLNTVSAEVLVALLPGQSEPSLAAALEAARPFESLEAALSWVEARAGPEAVALLDALGADIGSAWFEARLQARLDSTRLRRRVVMRRTSATCCQISLVLPEIE